MKKKTRSQLVKEADKFFSQYIRLLKSDNKGICTCITCGAKIPRTQIQNGHFISRSVYSLRRDETNNFPQDAKCNIFLHGNYQVYTLKMQEMFGKEKVEEMVYQKYQIQKISNDRLIENIEKRKQEIKRIKAEKGLQ